MLGFGVEAFFRLKSLGFIERSSAFETNLSLLRTEVRWYKIAALLRGESLKGSVALLRCSNDVATKVRWHKMAALAEK